MGLTKKDGIPNFYHRMSMRRDSKLEKEMHYIVYQTEQFMPGNPYAKVTPSATANTTPRVSSDAGSAVSEMDARSDVSDQC